MRAMQMKHRYAPGVVYALAVFAVGFGMGAVRVGLLVPRVGATVAVLAEAPVMLLASWWICNRLIAHFRVAASTTDRALMGSIAFGTLQLAEWGVSMLAFHRSFIDYASSLGSVPGLIGLLAQVAFAAFPALQLEKRQ